MEGTQDKVTYFKNLDGIRFLCFLSVFFFHSFHTDYEYIKETQVYTFVKKDIFGNGNLGVNFFFVLSGFLITYLLIHEKKANGYIDLKKFWMRRILRIWPLFYFCVFFGFVIFPQIKAFFGQIPSETANPIYFVTFLNNFDFIRNGLPDASVLGVLWSVAIEEQFYLFWPLILYIFPVKRYWIPFAAIIAGSLVFRSFYDSYTYHEYHTLSCIGDMTIGAFGAWLIYEKSQFRAYIQNLSRISIYFIYIVFILVYFFRDEVLFASAPARIIERSLIAVVILLIILEQNYAEKSFYKMKNFKLISNLGQITYGLYCLHFIGILIVLKITGRLVFNTQIWQVMILETILALIVSIAIAKLSFRYFETPFLRLKEKFAPAK